jgi:hypothetical protein
MAAAVARPAAAENLRIVRRSSPGARAASRNSSMFRNAAARCCVCPPVTYFLPQVNVDDIA